MPKTIDQIISEEMGSTVKQSLPVQSAVKSIDDIIAEEMGSISSTTSPTPRIRAIGVDTKRGRGGQRPGFIPVPPRTGGDPVPETMAMWEDPTKQPLTFPKYASAVGQQTGSVIKGIGSGAATLVNDLADEDEQGYQLHTAPASDGHNRSEAIAAETLPKPGNLRDFYEQSSRHLFLGGTASVLDAAAGGLNAPGVAIDAMADTGAPGSASVLPTDIGDPAHRLASSIRGAMPEPATPAGHLGAIAGDLAPMIAAGAVAGPPGVAATMGVQSFGGTYGQTLDALHAQNAGIDPVLAKQTALGTAAVTAPIETAINMIPGSKLGGRLAGMAEHGLGRMATPTALGNFAKEVGLNTAAGAATSTVGQIGQIKAGTQEEFNPMEAVRTAGEYGALSVGIGGLHEGGRQIQQGARNFEAGRLKELRDLRGPEGAVSQPHPEAAPDQSTPNKNADPAQVFRDSVIPTPADPLARWLEAAAEDRGAKLIFSSPKGEAGDVRGMYDEGQVYVNADILGNRGQFGMVSAAHEAAIDEIAHRFDDVAPAAANKVRSMLTPETLSKAADDYVAKYARAMDMTPAEAEKHLTPDGIYRESFGTAMQMGLASAETRARILEDPTVRNVARRIWDGIAQKFPGAVREKTQLREAFQSLWKIRPEENGQGAENVAPAPDAAPSDGLDRTKTQGGVLPGTRGVAPAPGDVVEGSLKDGAEVGDVLPEDRPPTVPQIPVLDNGMPDGLLDSKMATDAGTGSHAATLAPPAIRRKTEPLPKSRDAAGAYSSKTKILKAISSQAKDDPRINYEPMARTITASDHEAENFTSPETESYTFHKQLPGEIRTLLEGRPYARKLFKVTDDANAAGGADWYAHVHEHHGEEAYHELVDWSTRREKVHADRLDAMIRGGYHPEAEFMKSLAERVGLGKFPTHAIDEPARTLPIDTEFKSGGRVFRVETDADDVKVATDSVTGKQFDLGAFESIPVDQGSIRRGKPRELAETPADDVPFSVGDSERVKDIFGKDITPSIKGKQGDLIDVGPSKAERDAEWRKRRTGESYQDHQIRMKFGTEKKLKDHPTLFSIGAWHGTPHDFDEFKSEKIGTGEGAQAYGHGLYFAGNKEIAQYYQKKLTDQFGKNIPRPVIDTLKANDNLGFDSPQQALAAIRTHPDWAQNWDVQDPTHQKTINDYINAPAKGKGRLFKVELAPEEHELLDWDKSLDEQSDHVRHALLDISTDESDLSAETGKDFYAKLSKRLGTEAGKNHPDWMKGTLIADDVAASKALRAVGIRGIRYLDSGGRVPDVLTQRMRSVLNKHDNNIEAALDEYMRSVYDTPKQKELTRQATKAAMEKLLGPQHNYVIFNDKDVSIKERFSIGPTIRVQGLDRPTRDSEGKLLHPTLGGIRNFWNWFGDSKVVDSKGAPLVVYHGTNAEFSTFSKKKTLQGTTWFTSDRASIEKGESGASGTSKIMELYARINNPADWKQYDKLLLAQFKSEGLDGAVLKQGDRIDGFVFDPEQLKSATGNRGTFDPNKKDIRFSVGGGPSPEQVKRTQSSIEAEKAAAAEDRSDRELVGRPELANPVDPLAADGKARGLVDAVDQARKDLGIPPVKSDAETFAQADDILKASSYAQEGQRLLDLADKGDQLSDVDTVVAQRVVANKALQAVLTGDESAFADAVYLANAYRETGTEQARAFRQRRDQFLTPAERLAQLITAPSKATEQATTKLQQELDATQDPAKRAKIQAKLKAAAQQTATQAKEITRQIRAQGINPATLSPSQLSDRAIIDRIGRVVLSTKATVPDKFQEYYRNALLSNPRSWNVKAMSDVVHGGWEMFGQRALEAAVNKAIGNKGVDAKAFADYPAMARGFMPAVAEAGKVFLRTYATEQTSWANQIRSGAVGQMGVFQGKNEWAPHTAISAPKGRIIRTPQRIFGAIDQFTQALYGTMEAYAIAHRTAAAKGINGMDQINEANKLLADPSNPIYLKALKEAERITFHGDGTPDVLTDAILKLRKSVPGLYYQIPFVTIPMNILKAGMAKTPVVGQIMPSVRIMRALADKKYYYSKDKISRDIVNTAIGWGVTAALWNMVAGNDPDDEGYITGAMSRKPGEAALQRRTANPMSIKIGGKWMSYSRVEPFATMFATIVDGIHAAKTAKDTGAFQAAMGSVGKSLLGQLQEKTFLKGISDIVDAIENRSEDGAGLGRWAANFTASWVPAVVSQGQASAMKTLPESKTRVTETRGMLATVGLRAAQRAFPLLTNPQPKIDPWGQPIDARNIPGYPKTDYLYRVLSPLRLTPDDENQIDRMIVNWNNKVDADAAGGLVKYEPTTPPATVAIRGQAKPYKLSDEEYTEFLQESGQNAARKIETLIKGGVLNPANPTARNIERIKEIREEEMATWKRRFVVKLKERPRK